MIKRCSTCRAVKLTTEFYNGSGVGGTQNNCKVCSKAHNRARKSRQNDPTTKHNIAKALAQKGLKQCSRCLSVFAASEFYTGCSGRLRVSHVCKTCFKADRRASYNDPVSGKARQLRANGAESRMRKKYGLSVIDYDALFVEQDGKCACCRREIFRFNSGRKSAHVDHCHESGSVRGLLCPWCNVAIGLASDNIWVLEQMAVYLERCSNTDNRHTHFKAVLPQYQTKEKEKMAPKSKQELLKQIADATPSGGGNQLRDGRYRLAVKKLALESGFKGARWGMDFVVMHSSKIPVVEIKTNKVLDIEPNAPGTDVGIVKMLEGKGNYEPPGFGDTKTFVLALFGVTEEIESAELVSTLDELDSKNAAYGMVIDCVTRRKVSKENEVEMVLQDWFRVEQNDADIMATRRWIESLVVAQTPARAPGAPAVPPGPPAGPPAAA